MPQGGLHCHRVAGNCRRVPGAPEPGGARRARLERGVGSAWMCHLAVVPAVILAAVAVVPAADTLPQRLEGSSCYKPKGLDHVQGHLLFGYLVSAQGRVDHVRLYYDRVEPQKDRQAVILHLTECLNGWKFRPGTKGGRTAEYYQLVPFHFFKPAPENDLEVPVPGGGTLGLSRIQEMYEEKMRLAEKLLSGRTYSRIEGDGWVLRTNVRPKVVKNLQKAFDLARLIFETAFPNAPPLPDETPVEIVLFRDIRDYSMVVAFDNLLDESHAGSGAYSERDHTIYAAVGAKPPAIFTELLVHEACHHLITMRLYGGDRQAPAWVDEGIASFIAGVRQPRKKSLDLSRLDRRRTSGGGFYWVRNVGTFLATLKRTVKAGTLPPLDDLLEGRFDESFRRGGWDLYYGMSWLLVHYLINADGGKYRPGFERWISSEAGSTGDPGSLAAALGIPLEQVEAALPGYLKSLK